MNRALVALLSLCALASSASGQALTVKRGSPLTFERLAVKAEVEEGVALVDVDQTFHNRTGDTREGIYRFHLPADAVVHTFSLWIAGKEKQGCVYERRFARRVYERIRDRREDPALLEQTGFRTFRVSVFPIPPRSDVRLRLRYAHVVPDDLGLYRLEVPVIEGGSTVRRCSFRATIRDRRGLSMIEFVDRPDAEVEVGETVAKVHLVEERWKPDGPFVVRFMPRREGLDLSVLTHREPGDEDGWFLVRVLPKLPKAAPLPRDVVFVFDRSGSMRGEKVGQARKALLHGLATLRAGDRFNVVTFASDAKVMRSDGLIEATPSHLGKARILAKSVEAAGGTNIDVALRTAVALREPDAKRLFLLVFLTDGEATVGPRDPAKILEGYRAASDGTVRLFALGVGEGAKHFLLTKLARGSRGHAHYVREGENLEVPLSSLFSKVECPLLGAPTISIEGVEAYDIVPRPLPDLFRRDALVLAGRFRGGGEATLKLTGDLRTGPVEITVPVTFPTTRVRRPHVAQLWAKRKIDRLIDDLRIHPDVHEIRDSIVDLGIRYKVVTPYTSFLVVEPGERMPEARAQARAARRHAVPFSGGRPGGRWLGPYADVPPSVRWGGLRERGGGAPPIGPSAPSGDLGAPPPSDQPVARDAPPPDGDWADDGSADPVMPGENDTGAAAPADRPAVGGGAPIPPPALAGKHKRAYRSNLGSWEFWWAHNRDSLLDFRSGLPDTPAAEEIVRKTILPILREIHDDETYDSMTRSHALLALAKIGATRPDLSADVARRLIASMNRDNLGPGRRRITIERETACFALGLLGRKDEAVVKTLCDRLEAPFRTPELPAGVSGTRRIKQETCRAALALALLAIPKDDPSHERVTKLLAERLRDRPNARPDLCWAILAGLGVRGGVSHVPLVEEVALDRDREDLARAHAVEALGRILSRHPASFTAEMFRRLDTTLARNGSHRSRSWVIAAGRIGASAGIPDALRADLVAMLSERSSRGDEKTACLAVVSLGRIGGATGSAKLTDRVRRLLVRRIEKGEPHLQPYAALALGMMGRASSNESDREKIREVLRREFRTFKGTIRNRSACLLALGLLGDPKATRDLQGVLRTSSRGTALRGYAAVALAMLEGPDAARRIRSQFDRGRKDGHARPFCAALGMAGDASDLDRLSEVVRARTRTGYEPAEAVRAIVRIGGPASVDRLVTLFRDRNVPGMHKTLAIAGLGQMADRRGLPVIRDLCRDVNHRATVTPMQEILSLP